MHVLIIMGLVLLAVLQVALAGDEQAALVVAVASYQQATALASTRDDASDVGETLQRLDFMVQTVLKPDRAAFERTGRQLVVSAPCVEAAAFFYAGYALEIGVRSWLLPISITINTQRNLQVELNRHLLTITT